MGFVVVVAVDLFCFVLLVCLSMFGINLFHCCLVFPKVRLRHEKAT